MNKVKKGGKTIGNLGEAGEWVRSRSNGMDARERFWEEKKKILLGKGGRGPLQGQVRRCACGNSAEKDEVDEGLGREITNGPGAQGPSGSETDPRVNKLIIYIKEESNKHWNACSVGNRQKDQTRETEENHSSYSGKKTPAGLGGAQPYRGPGKQPSGKRKKKRKKNLYGPRGKAGGLLRGDIINKSAERQGKPRATPWLVWKRMVKKEAVMILKSGGSTNTTFLVYQSKARQKWGTEWGCQSNGDGLTTSKSGECESTGKLFPSGKQGKQFERVARWWTIGGGRCTTPSIIIVKGAKLPEKGRKKEDVQGAGRMIIEIEINLFNTQKKIQGGKQRSDPERTEECPPEHVFRMRRI